MFFCGRNGCELSISRVVQLLSCVLYELRMGNAAESGYLSSDEEEAYGEDQFGSREEGSGTLDSEEGDGAAELSASDGDTLVDRRQQQDVLKRQQEMNEFARANFEPAPLTEPWFVVSSAWLSAWQQYTFFGNDQHPGMIVNATLVDAAVLVRAHDARSSNAKTGSGGGNGALRRRIERLALHAVRDARAPFPSHGAERGARALTKHDLKPGLIAGSEYRLLNRSTWSQFTRRYGVDYTIEVSPDLGEALVPLHIHTLRAFHVQCCAHDEEAEDGRRQLRLVVSVIDTRGVQVHEDTFEPMNEGGGGGNGDSEGETLSFIRRPDGAAPFALHGECGSERTGWREATRGLVLAASDEMTVYFTLYRADGGGRTTAHDARERSARRPLAQAHLSTRDMARLGGGNALLELRSATREQEQVQPIGWRIGANAEATNVEPWGGLTMLTKPILEAMRALPHWGAPNSLHTRLAQRFVESEEKRRRHAEQLSRAQSRAANSSHSSPLAALQHPRSVVDGPLLESVILTKEGMAPCVRSACSSRDRCRSR